MDFDGTDDIQESVAMCKFLKSQGVATVCATPHFYPWKEDVDTFISRRNAVFAKLQAADFPLKVIPGAEVQIFQSLCECRADKMCIGESNVILFEIPDMPFQKWMVTAIENTVYRYSLIPQFDVIESKMGEQPKIFAKSLKMTQALIGNCCLHSRSWKR